MKRLREELDSYYKHYRWDDRDGFPEENMRIRRRIIDAMDSYLKEHPDEHPSLIKTRLHEAMAENFEPVIFSHSPFFFEMGLRFAENWGVPASPEYTVGGWMYERRKPLLAAFPETRYVRAFGGVEEQDKISVWNIHGGFDNDHHCLGYTKLLKTGLKGIIKELEERKKQPCSPDQSAVLEAMERSCRAVLKISRRFGEKAREILEGEEDPKARKFLAMISEASEHIPADPPRTFYEGLAMIWFLREVTASLEAIGVSVVGHLDRLLIDLYRADIAEGRLTEAEARDLLARWMLPTDVKFHVDDNPWPETSTCMELGGCDADGNPVYNELTKLIIEVHRENKLFNPKPNCRYGNESPREYLDLISGAILGGHNHFALLNDGMLIPACVRAGKTEREARLYVNGGCQETIVEGVEHSAGAYFYFSMPRVMDLCLQPIDELPPDLAEEAAAQLPKQITEAADFEEFYNKFVDETCRMIRLGADWACKMGREHWRIHPSPFFSTTLEGCISNAADYTKGSAKYNPSGIALVGLGTIIDSLIAVKKAVFEEKWVTLDELRRALEEDWKGYETLRAKTRRLPRFGHGHPEADELAALFAGTLAEVIRTTPSERGGTFQGSFFVYYAFQWFGRFLRATPDGRKKGDLLTQGIAPDRTTAPGSLTDVFHSLSRIDFRDYPGNAVLDVQLPAGNAIPAEKLTALIRTFAGMNGPTLQFNCVSIEDMRDAQANPEKHRGLVVRISGLSARFVCLTKEVQDEIIDRAAASV